MQLLAAIGHDDDLLRAQPADPVPDPGQVGGRIVIAGIAFLHDHRQRVAVNVKEAVQVGAQGIIVFYQQALFGQLTDDPGQVIPVEALRAIMGSVQADVELPVQAMARMQGLVRQRLPHGKGLRVAGLQVVHFFGGAERKLSTGSLQGAPPGIQFFHRLQRRGLQAPEAGTVFLLDHRNQHAEIGAPVPVMILAQHLVTQEFQYPGNRVADDRRAHGAHVQVLGQVGAGIVHHDALRMRRPLHAATRVGQRARQFREQRRILQPDVDETGSGNLDGLYQCARAGLTGDGFEIRPLPDRFNNRPGNFARAGLLPLRQQERQVGLVVTELPVLARRHLALERLPGARKTGRNGLVQYMPDRFDKTHVIDACFTP